MQQLGLSAAPESLLVSAYMSHWQRAMHGQPANSCVAAVLTMQRCLESAGIPVEPVTVRATVDYRDGRPPATVGSPLPAVDSDGLWTGHLAMWLPTLGRFVDPTIYQVNAAGRGQQMVMGIILAPPTRADLDGLGCEKNGSLVTYWLVDDPVQTWRERITPAVTRAVQSMARAVNKDVMAWLRNDVEGVQVASSITEPGIVAALTVAGIRS